MGPTQHPEEHHAGVRSEVSPLIILVHDRPLNTKQRLNALNTSETLDSSRQQTIIVNIRFRLRFL